MHFLKTLFRKKLHPNPAIDQLLHATQVLEPQAQAVISKIPELSKAYKEGGAYLLEKTLLGPIEEYDGQFGSGLSDTIGDKKKAELLKILTSLMLLTFFKELSGLFREARYAALLSNALHFELYGEIPITGSFVDYLNYQNPNFDDLKMVPAYKFGNDVAASLQIPDLSFSFMVAQQAAVISDISRLLMRWVLFDEPLEETPANP